MILNIIHVLQIIVIDFMSKKNMLSSIHMFSCIYFVNRNLHNVVMSTYDLILRKQRVHDKYYLIYLKMVNVRHSRCSILRQHNNRQILS